MGALGVGSGLIFLLDFFDTSLRNPDEFESSLGVAVLATVPRIYHKKDLRLKRINKVLTGFFILISVCLFAGFALLAVLGVEPIMEMIQNLPELWANNTLFSK